MKKKLIIIGAGGFAKAVIDSLDYDEYVLEGFIDSLKSGMHQGYPIVGHSLSDIRLPTDYYYFIAIGNPDDRALWLRQIQDLNLDTINVIDRTAIVSTRSSIGTCIYIGKMAIVNCDSQLEDGVVINTRALIEHGNYISYCTNVSTN
ncbi:TPA: shikimate dehydrogenase, partial [Escherichia coli]|nr:shikimate dehydrogenase [Escherichia coli]